MKSVAIIVPTIGSLHLERCVSSIRGQIYPNIKPYYIIDGSEHGSKTYHICGNRNTYELKENVGANGWYGHRIFAAFSFLVNEDYVCFLDEDNWLEPDHVEKMVQTIEEENLDWTHCLRNIYKKDGTFVCKDECESLGTFPVWTYDLHNQNDWHIDTSSFMVKRENLVRVAQSWYGQWGQDRVFGHTLAHYFPNWKTIYNFSLNYRLGGNPGSVTEKFFTEGNKYYEEKFGDRLPWRKNQIQK